MTKKKMDTSSGAEEFRSEEPGIQEDYEALLNKLELPELEPGLENQVKIFLKSFIGLDQSRERKRSTREYAMICYKLCQFIFSREQRLDDIRSDEVRDAIAIKSGLLPLGTPKLSICVDARVSPKLHGGLHGNAFRTAAGDNAVEFLPQQTGKGLYLKEGKFTDMINEALEQTDVLFEEFDSHKDCTARGEHSEEIEGEMPEDKGLKDDVLQKRRMINALKRYVKERYGDAKQIVCIQTSFNPKNGYIYTGLEFCLRDRRVIANGFTDNVLDELALEGKIISTQHLVEGSDSFFRDLFAKYYFDINYPENYRENTLSFWKNIQEMRQQALPRIRETLQAVFPELKKTENEQELNQRALLLLSNAYSGYLHNYTAEDVKDDKKYPFAEHDESTIVVSYSDKGPYDRARAFNIDPQTRGLAGVINFVQKLIRKNRRLGRMSKLEKEARDVFYQTPDQQTKEYAKAPILIHLFERLNEKLDPTILEKIRTIDWSDLQQTDWMNMDDRQFRIEYLEKKYRYIPGELVDAINDLRRRAKQLFEEGEAAESLLHGRLVLVCTLSGPDRETYGLIPFMAKGYRKPRRRRLAAPQAATAA